MIPRTPIASRRVRSGFIVASVPGITGISTMTCDNEDTAAAMRSNTGASALAMSSGFTLKRTSSSPACASFPKHASSSKSPHVYKRT